MPCFCSCCLPSWPCAAASRLVQPRKPSGKLGGGLGVKKLATKVDDTLFEQPPAAPEPPKPAAPTPEAAAAEAAAQAGSSSASSRFAYDTLTAAPSAAGSSGGVGGGDSAVQRGKDGHLTLGLSNDDFFRDPLSNKGLGGRPGSGQYGGYGGGGAAASRGADPEPVAQKKFGNAKAISSK